MALDLAEQADAQGNASHAALLRARATTIATATVANLYVSQTTSHKVNGSAPGDIGGWWRVADLSGKDSAAEVRHVVDFVYSTAGFASPRWPAFRALNDTMAAQMKEFALRQLLPVSR